MTETLEITDTGSERRVGVEIELSGITIAKAAEIVSHFFGGELRYLTDYEIEVNSPELGEFRIEVDFALLKKWGKARAETGSAQSVIDQLSEEMLASLAQQIAPSEIVTPPLPWQRVADLDKLVMQLQQAGAKGTDDSLVYAFGVHFNPQAPSLTATSICSYLRAFVLLYDWLQKQAKLDFSRRVSPFINAFPGKYVELILAADYEPDQDQLLDDYLAYNPTRNRALDLLPLLAYIDAPRVYTYVNDSLVKPRPTYHYRLPNSRVGDPAWRLSDEWQQWLILERLVQKPLLIAAMSEDYLSCISNPLNVLKTEWQKRTAQWLNDAQLL